MRVLVHPRHLARGMALTNRLRTRGTANLLAAAGRARLIAQGVAYAYDPAGSPVKDEDAPLWRNPGGRGGAERRRRPAHPGPGVAARDGGPPGSCRAAASMTMGG